MKKYIAVLLVTALAFVMLNIPVFAAQENDEIALLAPPSGKLTVYPVQLKNDEGQPEENAEFSASNLPGGVVLNKNGKLVLNGDEVADGDFSINATKY